MTCRINILIKFAFFSSLVSLCLFASGQEQKKPLLTGHKEYIKHAMFSSDNSTVVTVAYDSTIKIWGSNSGNQLASIKTNIYRRVILAELSPDGKKIITYYRNNSANIWDATSGKLTATLKVRKKRVIESVLISPDSKTIFTTNDKNHAQLWDAESGKVNLKFKGKNFGIYMSEFAPDGKKLISNHYDPKKRSDTYKIWDIKTGQNIGVLESQNYIDLTNIHYNPLQFSPDSRLVISFNGNSIPKLLDAKTGKLLFLLIGHTGEVNSAIFSTDGKRILTCSEDKTAKIWDASTGILNYELKNIQTAIFSPDCKYVISASDSIVRIRDIVSGALIRELKGHTQKVSDLVFSPDGKKIITVSKYKTAKLWQIENGVLIADFTEPNNSINFAQFSSDGKMILIVYHTTAKVWDASSGALITELK